MKTKIFFVGLFLMMLGIISANAQNHKENANGEAKATVIKALTIANTSNLEFGTFAGRNSTASTVIVSVTGSRATSTADLIGNDGLAGTFVITGEPGAVVSITLPTSTVNLVGTDAAAGGADMTIGSGTWVTNQVSNSSVTLTAVTGVVTLKVGATLAVGAAQKAGPYSGSFTVSVNYN